jgi:hypothetical protein
VQFLRDLDNGFWRFCTSYNDPCTLLPASDDPVTAHFLHLDPFPWTEVGEKKWARVGFADPSLALSVTVETLRRPWADTVRSFDGGLAISTTFIFMPGTVGSLTTLHFFKGRSQYMMIWRIFALALLITMCGLPYPLCWAKIGLSKSLNDVSKLEVTPLAGGIIVKDKRSGLQTSGPNMYWGPKIHLRS